LHSFSEKTDAATLTEFNARSANESSGRQAEEANESDSKSENTVVLIGVNA
jgi:hypothetical protein